MPEHAHDGNGWNEYQKLVMSKLETLETKADTMQETLTLHKVELALIKQKSGLWGAISGCLSAMLMMAVAYIRSKAA